MDVYLRLSPPHHPFRSPPSSGLPGRSVTFFSRLSLQDPTPGPGPSLPLPLPSTPLPSTPHPLRVTRHKESKKGEDPGPEDSSWELDVPTLLHPTLLGVSSLTRKSWVSPRGPTTEGPKKSGEVRDPVVGRSCRGSVVLVLPLQWVSFGCSPHRSPILVWSGPIRSESQCLSLPGVP